ncbi:cupin domain-containing protein [Ensifer adhaerens]
MPASRGISGARKMPVSLTAGSTPRRKAFTRSSSCSPAAASSIRWPPAIFGAYEVLYVLSGTLGLANPETGEFCIAKEGEALFFRKETWHHGFNLGNEQVRVLEFFAPPPAKGTSGPYARTKPYIEIEQSRYGQSRSIGRWPMDADAQRKARTIHSMRDADLLLSLDRQTQGAYTGLYCATDQLTVGKTTLLSGKRTGMERHKGDECLYLVSGILNIHVPDAESQVWFELNPRDGFRRVSITNIST